MAIGVQASPTVSHNQFNEREGNDEGLDEGFMRRRSIVILDVGGEKFIALKRTLARLPTTRLGKLVRAQSVRSPFCGHSPDMDRYDVSAKFWNTAMSFFLGKCWSIFSTRIQKILPQYSTYTELGLVVCIFLNLTSLTRISVKLSLRCC